VQQAVFGGVGGDGAGWSLPGAADGVLGVVIASRVWSAEVAVAAVTGRICSMPGGGGAQASGGSLCWLMSRPVRRPPVPAATSGRRLTWMRRL
jgi:hypothetical protein